MLRRSTSDNRCSGRELDGVRESKDAALLGLKFDQKCSRSNDGKSTCHSWVTSILVFDVAAQA